jgi:hypothetical protein
MLPHILTHTHTHTHARTHTQIYIKKGKYKFRPQLEPPRLWTWLINFSIQNHIIKNPRQLCLEGYRGLISWVKDNRRIKMTIHRAGFGKGNDVDSYSGGTRFESRRDTGNREGGFSWFSQCECWDSTSISLRPLPPKSFPIHHLLTILPFEDILSDLLLLS